MRFSKFIRGVDPNEPRESMKVPRRHQRGPQRKTYAFAHGPKAIGAYLRACRWRGGRKGQREWSLRSVAHRAEINAGLLSQIETGKRRPVADDVIRLADVLDADREELLVRAGYLPESALANRGEFQLTAAERDLIRRVRARPGLVAALVALLTAAG